MAAAACVLLSSCAAAARSPETVVFASGVDLESANPLVTIHPLSKQIQRHVLFVTLARLDSALQPAPYLARSWEFSEDGKELRLILHNGLRWHDGRPTTARDALWTIEAARNPASRYPRAADLAGVSDVNAPDDTTLVLNFSSSQPFFPPVLSELPVLPAHLLEDIPLESMRTHAFSLAPTGNGPFRFVERSPGRRWVFERNEQFPMQLGGPPEIRRLVIAVVDEATTKFAGLVSGELDVAGISPSMASLVAEDPSLRVLSYPLPLVTGIVFNSHREPFDDPRVRRAVSLSVDRTRIVDVALAGYGIPSASPVVPDNPLALDTDWQVRSEAADSLYDAAGWKRGADGIRRKDTLTFDFELLTVGSANNEIEQLIQADLLARGIRMRIRSVEFASFLSRAREVPKTFDAIITGIPGDLSLAYIASMFDGALAGSALDYAAFHTDALDSLFMVARAAASVDALRDGWVEVQRELAREMPVAWLYHSRGVQGLSGRLEGVVMDLRGELTSVARWSGTPRRARTR